MFIICFVPICFCSGGGLNLQPNFQKGGDLTGPQLSDEGCWEIGGDFFQGWGRGWGLQFSPQKKLKFQIFNDKKSL